MIASREMGCQGLEVGGMITGAVSERSSIKVNADISTKRDRRRVGRREMNQDSRHLPVAIDQGQTSHRAQQFKRMTHAL